MTGLLPPGGASSASRWADEEAARFSKVYRSGRRRSRYAIILLAVIGGIYAVSVTHDIAGFGLIARAESGVLTDAEALDFDAFTRNIVIASLVFSIPCIIAFLAWLSRSVDNAPSLGGGIPVATPRWSIGWWFVPLASLWKPYQIVKDLNKRMANGPATGGALLLAWWLCFNIGNIVSRIVSRLPEPNDLDGLRTQLTAAAISESITVVAAALAIYVIFHIQQQAETRANLRSTAASGPSAGTDLDEEMGWASARRIVGGIIIALVALALIETALFPR